jgi:hypothetical protein
MTPSRQCKSTYSRNGALQNMEKKRKEVNFQPEKNEKSLSSSGYA